jgi:hypothetical protein
MVRVRLARESALGTVAAMSLPSTAHAVVVGARLAGLRAARGLVAAGLEVVVSEAADRVGGRTATDVVDLTTVGVPDALPRADPPLATCGGRWTPATVCSPPVTIGTRPSFRGDGLPARAPRRQSSDRYPGEAAA